MTRAEETCWTVVLDAASGAAAARDRFAEVYLRIVRSFLVKRWQGTALLVEVDDAVQEVFLDLFRDGGALAKLDPARATSFRGFLFGVAHRVALRHERRAARERDRSADGELDADAVAAEAASLSRVFDRAWAQAIVRRAGERLRAQALSAGDAAARQRVELLRLRFSDGLPIRDIARLWGEDTARLHHEYARARDEFKQALRAEVAYHHRGTPEEIERECKSLLELL